MTQTIYEEITNPVSAPMIKRTDEDGTIYWIPTDLGNSDYQAYLKSLEENN